MNVPCNALHRASVGSATTLQYEATGSDDHPFPSGLQQRFDQHADMGSIRLACKQRLTAGAEPLGLREYGELVSDGRSDGLAFWQRSRWEAKGKRSRRALVQSDDLLTAGFLLWQHDREYLERIGEGQMLRQNRRHRQAIVRKRQRTLRAREKAITDAVAQGLRPEPIFRPPGRLARTVFLDVSHSKSGAPRGKRSLTSVGLERSCAKRGASVFRGTGYGTSRIDSASLPRIHDISAPLPVYASDVGSAVQYIRRRMPRTPKGHSHFKGRAAGSRRAKWWCSDEAEVVRPATDCPAPVKRMERELRLVGCSDHGHAVGVTAPHDASYTFEGDDRRIPAHVLNRDTNAADNVGWLGRQYMRTGGEKRIVFNDRLDSNRYAVAGGADWSARPDAADWVAEDFIRPPT